MDAEKASAEQFLLEAARLGERGMAYARVKPIDFVSGSALMVSAAIVATLMSDWIRITVNRGMEAVQSAERAKSRLGAYISPEFAREVLERDSATRSRAAHEAAILFTDLRGFTSQGESTPPDQLFRELNDYFEVMVGVVLKHGGVVDKFMGDALMAVFGVPTADAGCPDRAVTAAIAMDRALRAHNIERQHFGLPPPSAWNRDPLRPGDRRRCRLRDTSPVHGHWRHRQRRFPHRVHDQEPRALHLDLELRDGCDASTAARRRARAEGR